MRGLWVLLLLAAPRGGAAAGGGLRLCRRLLWEARALARQYVAERLHGARIHLAPPPGHPLAVGILARDWLALTAPQRLGALGARLPLLRGGLGALGRAEGAAGRPDVQRRARSLGWDLRDLGRHIAHQLGELPAPPAPAPPAPPGAAPPPPGGEWRRRRAAWALLRALERFLLRALRDFALLRPPATATTATATTATATMATATTATGTTATGTPPW